MLKAIELVLLICTFVYTSYASDKWGYGPTKGGVYGSDDWDKVSAICGMHNQSPVDIDTSRAIRASGLPRLVVKFSRPRGMVSGNLINTGHAPTFNPIRGTAKLRRGQYKLGQFHFHYGCENGKGSEHTINGAHFDAELHFVFYNTAYGTLGNAASKPDGLVVVGVLLKKTRRYSGWYMRKLANSMPLIKAVGSKVRVNSIALDRMVRGLSSGRLAYYTYRGSLTTPPCYESVDWIVLKRPIAISQKDLEKFRMLEGEHGRHMCGNFRPVQNLNGRKVYFRDHSTPGEC